MDDQTDSQADNPADDPHRIDYCIRPNHTGLSGELTVPGDKSISHRALLLAALAVGTSEIHGCLDSADTRATMQALEQMGVAITQTDAGICMAGVGKAGLQSPGQPLDCGNSGTLVRLLSGILAAQTFDTALIGDASLMQRPMRRITEPLERMGAVITTTEAGTLPMHIRGGRPLHGITYELPVASAQLKSAILLAGLYARGETTVHQPLITRDHTERMLIAFGADLRCDGERITVSASDLQASPVKVPADISSAAFFLVAASITPGADITLNNVGMNPTRHAIVGLLQAMGADITIKRRDSPAGAEPIADLRVRHSRLTGITIPPAAVPVAIDELPVLMIAAAVAEGETCLRGAGELRVKESDRIAVMVAGLRQLGIAVEEFADGMQVAGAAFTGGEVDSGADHRIAMAFSIAGLVAAGPVVVQDCANVATSFPGFTDCLGQLGADISVMQHG